MEDRWRLGHQPSLQGIRGLAVLAVFAFHVGVVSGGWLGVEAFFVLSGFLITILLLQDRRDGSFGVLPFYTRRLARLLPAALAVLLVLMTFSIVTGYSVDSHRDGALASVLYYANWAEVTGGELAGLGHMWSLSIEEQFYFVWPLALMALTSRWGSRGVAIAAAAAFITSAGLRFMLTGSEGWFDRVYYASDTRAAGLLAGCCAGALLVRSRGRLATFMPAWVGVIAVALLASAFLVLDDHAPTTWQFAVTALDAVVAALLLTLVGQRTWLSRVLSWSPLVYIGDISYGLYLWHMPIIWAVAQTLDGPARVAVQIFAPFLAAAASYRYLEVPVRKWARRLEQGRRVPSAANNSG